MDGDGASHPNDWKTGLVIEKHIVVSAEHAIVAGHRLQGQPLLPGMGFIDIAYQVLDEAGFGCATTRLRDLMIHRPLAIAAGEKIRLAVSLTASDAGGLTLEISGQPRRAGRAAGPSQTYVRAAVDTGVTIGYDAALASDELAEGAGTVDFAEIYGACEARGLVHRGPMRVQGRVRYDAGQALALLSVDPAAGGAPDDYLFHPALLDAAGLSCWRQFADAAQPADAESLFIPLFIESFHCSAPLRSTCRTRVRTSTRRQSSELIHLTIELFDEHGRQVGAVVNLTGKSVRHAASAVRSEREAPPRGAGGAAPLVEFLTSKVAGLLGVPCADIEAAASFYELGLDSQQLLALSQLLSDRLARPLSPILPFEHPSIAQLAAHLHDEGLGLPDDPVGTTTAVASMPVEAGTPAAARIAIVGMAGRYPGAQDLAQFWQRLAAGEHSVGEIPASRWDWRRYAELRSDSGRPLSRWGGFLDDVDCFDTHFFRIAPREAETMDPQARLFLEAAWEAMEDAGCLPEDLEAPGQAPVGVYVGAMHSDYALLGSDAYLRGERFPLALNHAPIANRVSYVCGFHGPSLVVDTVCSSSLTALHLAVQALSIGEIGAAIVGGVNLSLHPNKYLSYGLSDLHATDGTCRAFGAGGDGYVPAEGVGALLLKPLQRAERDGDSIYAVIRATSANHVGKVTGFTVPCPNAQAAAIQACATAAGIDPATIGYIEAHGTGTSIGDPIEIRGLVKAFEGVEAPDFACVIGSVKSNIGHAESAAGIAGLTKVALQLHHRVLVKSLHADPPNPLIDWPAIPFRVQRWTAPWRHDDESHPRRAGITSVGATGSNVHVLLEEYVDRRASGDRPAAVRRQWLPVSARNAQALQAYVARLQRFAAETAVLDLPALARSFQQGRVQLRERVLFACDDAADLAALLRHAVQHGLQDHPRILCGGVDGPLGLSLEAEQACLAGFSEGDERETARSLLEDWLSGRKTSWQRLPGSRPAVKLRAPTYPFARTRYWLPLQSNVSGVPALAPPVAAPMPAPVPAPASVVAAPAPAAPAAAMGLSFFEETWVPAPLPAVREAALEGSVVCIVQTAAHWTHWQAAFARHAGLRVMPVVTETLAPCGTLAVRYARCLDDIASAGHEIAAILWLEALEDEADDAILETAFHLVKALATTRLRVPRVLVPADWTAEGSLRQCHHEALIGFERSLGMVVPGTRLAVVFAQAEPDRADDARRSRWVDRLIGECRVPSTATVLYGPQGRSRLALQEQAGGDAPLANECPLKMRGSYLITGGFGGLGRLFARHLVTTVGANVVLAGRSPLDAGKRAFLDELRRQGAKALYIEADVADAAALARGLAEARAELGRIDGVIHAAGIEADTALADADWPRFRRVIEPKIAGTIALDAALDQALRGDEPDFVCYFSSSSAMLGDFGSCSYAVGNRFQMAYGRARASLGRARRAIVINWPLWAEGGMGAAGDDRVATYLKSSGQQALSSADGLRAFDDTLRRGAPQRLVLCGQRDRLLRMLGIEEPRPAAAPVRQAGGGPARAHLPATGVELRLRQIAADVLKSSVAEVHPRETFADQGFDSLTLIAYAKAVSEDFGVRITPALFYSHLSIGALALHLQEIAPGPGPAAMVPEPAPASMPAAVARPVAAVPEAAPAHGAGTVAIIGMSGRFPGTRDVDAMWQALAQGQCLVEEIPASRFDWRVIGSNSGGSSSRGGDAADAFACRWMGCVPGVGEFDPLFFDLSPLEAASMDPRQRLLLQEAWRALEDACLGPQRLRRGRVSMFVGVEQGDYAGLSGGVSGLTDNHEGILAARLSYFLDLSGPSLAVNTACSSGLVAAHLACQSLQAGESDIALAAGANLMLTPAGFDGLRKMKMLSRQGRCATFDAAADGIVPAEAVVVIVLKLLVKARADGDPIHAVIAASGLNYDGRTNGITAPSGAAQEALVGGLYDEAGIAPSSIEYVVCHGTGTELGDPVEVNALGRAFRARTADRGFCALTSPKTNFGHCFAASGLVSVVNLVQAIRHGQIPPSLHFERCNEFIDWDDGPFFVNQALRDWPGRDGLRRGAVSAFGMSGTNAHLVIEGPVQAAADGDAAADGSGPMLLAVSARSEEALSRRIRQLHDALHRALQAGDRSPAGLLRDAVHTLLCGRHHFRHRCAFVADTLDEALAILQDLDRAAASRGKVPATFSPLALVKTQAQQVVDTLATQDRTARGAALRELAELYCQGYELDWQALLPGAGWLRLPGYPFDQTTHWVGRDAAAGRMATDGIEDDVEDHTEDQTEHDTHDVPFAAADTAAPADPATLRAWVAGVLVAEAAAYLQVRPEQIDRDDNLVDYGFDSVKLTEFADCLQRRLGLRVVATSLYSHPTVHRYAKHLVEAQGELIAARHAAQTQRPAAPAAPPAARPRPAAASAPLPCAQAVMTRPVDDAPIAIIGMSGRFPDARDIDAMWRIVERGIDTVREIPADRFDWRTVYAGDGSAGRNQTNSKWLAAMPGVAEFDPLFFELSPRQAQAMDPRQRIVLQEAWNALENAGYGEDDVASQRIGMFLGVEHGDYARLAGERAGMLDNHEGVLAARISYFLDLSGSNVSLNTACSSGLVALHQACASLRNGDCRTAMAAAINVHYTAEPWVGMTTVNMLSPRGRCSAFDDSADGIVPGEAAAVLVLKELDDAVADGDHVHAVIAASGVNYDGRTNGITAPSGASQARLIEDTYRRHRIDYEDIGYIVCHGTGTRLGDPIEVNALADAFRRHTARRGTCALTSAKTNFGHTFAASGLVSLICLAEAMRHATIPPSLHLERPNALVDWDDGPFFVNTASRPWTTEGGRPRMGAVSAFGMSGTNAHVVLREHVAEPVASRSLPPGPQLMVLSAKTPQALCERAEAMSAWLQARATGDAASFGRLLADVAYTLLKGRHHFRCRAAFVASTIDEAVERFAAVAQERALPGVALGTAAPKASGHGEASPALSALAAAPWSPEGDAAPRRQALEKLAQTYAAGQRWHWRAGFGAGHRTLPLPGYAFARDTYWLSLPEEPVRADVLHPLVQRNTSTFAVQRFSSRFRGDELVLKDHRVRGAAVLPGVAVLEMAAAAARLALDGEPDGAGGWIVRDLRWLAPLVVEGSPVDVHVVLRPEGDDCAFDVQAEGASSPVTHARGRIAPMPVAPQRADLAAVRERCVRTVDIAACRETLDAAGVHYGEAYRGLVDLQLGRDEALARIVLPAGARSTAASFAWHPCMLDAALHGCVALMADVGAGLMLPAAIDEVQLLGPTTEAMWSHLRAAPAGNEPADRFRYDVDLCTADGELRVRIRGLSLRAAPSDPRRQAAVPAAPPAPTETAEGLDVCLVPQWRPAPAVWSRADARSSAGGLDGCVLAFNADGLSPELAARHLGRRPIVHAAWRAGDDFQDVADRDDLGEIVLVVPGTAASLVDESLVDGQAAGIEACFRLVQALLRRGHARRALRWTVVTTHALHVTADGPPVDPLHAGVHGLFGCMAKEIARWPVRLVDWPADAPLDWDVLLQAPFGPHGASLAYRQGAWLTQVLLPHDGTSAAAWPADAQRGGAHVVIGGAGGLGECWTRWMAERDDAEFVWIGRRAPDDALQARIAGLREQGVRVTYLQADAADRASLTAARDRIKARFGRFRGLVHSAMVLDDQSLARMSVEQFTDVYRAKADTSLRLAQVFDGEQPDFVLFFSSLMSFVRNGGQGNYAAGCVFKDQLAHALRARWRCPVKVVNWGFWGTTGVVASEAYRRKMAEVGIGSISPEAGMAMLDRLMRSEVNQMVCVNVLGQPVLDAWTGGHGAGDPIAEPASIDAMPLAQLRAEAEACAALLATPSLGRLLLERLWCQLEGAALVGRAPFDACAARDGLPALYRDWFDESIGFLVRGGLLVRDGDLCRLAGAPLDAAEVLARWAVERAGLSVSGRIDAELALLDAALAGLGDVVAGRRPATELLFPGGSMHLVQSAYADHPLVEYFNRILADEVLAIVEQRLADDPQAHISLLEIGAGTGGTTRHVLARLAPHRARIADYRYTDISQAFLKHGREAFGPDHGFLSTSPFNVENDPASQRIPTARFDLVIATNVLHATSNIARSLDHARQVLRPGGQLLVNELAGHSLFSHLTFALLEGWWRYEDHALRIPGSPVLAPATWSAVLADAGFDAIRLLVEADERLGQQVIAARRPLANSIDERPFDDPAAARREDDRRMSASRSMNDTRPSARTPAGMPASGPLMPAVAGLLRDCVGECLGMTAAQIHDEQSFSEYGVDSIVAVNLVNALNERLGLTLQTTVLFDHGSIDQLSRHLMESHASALQRVPVLRPATAASQSPIGQDAAATDAPAPARRATRFDAAPPVRSAPVPAVTAPPAGATPAAVHGFVDAGAPGAARRVLIERPGTIDDLRLVDVALPPLLPHEVRVAVRAFSLNFGDLLCVRGLYPTMPPYPFTPGFEASGVVTETGSEVRSVVPGDAVIVGAGETLGAQATVLTCSESQLTPKPARLSFEEACALPVVAVTMLEAFERAGVKAGERVLVQTATGGTGLIAVQLARYLGVVVHATAGSDRKLDYLRGLGVEHVVNYRTADFEEEVLRATDGRGVDVVLNTLAGDAMQKGLRCLADGGRYVEIAMTALKSARRIDLSVLDDNQSFISIDLRKLGLKRPDRLAGHRETLLRLVDEGVLTATISRSFPLAELKRAYAALENRENIGKIVVTVPQAGIDDAREARTAAAPGLSALTQPIAVIGMSGRFASADTIEALGRDLAAGRELVREVTRWDLARHYAGSPNPRSCTRGGLLNDVDAFDAMFFSISGVEATFMDPQQRLFLEESWKALEDAGHCGDELQGVAVGVYAGCAAGDYSSLMRKRTPPQAFWGNSTSTLPARIAYFLDLQGPAVAVDTACSSSLVAMHLASQALRTREVDLALAGGVFVQSTAKFFVASDNAAMLSPDGRTHAFDHRANGFVPGEGVGVLVLKRYDDALRDGDHIHAVLRGSGVNQDGHSNGITAPSAKSQQRLITEVYRKFGVDASRIQMLEAHGTGTRLGDPIEFHALVQAYAALAPSASASQGCALGSIKTNIGHAASAAGVAGVVKAILAMRSGQVFPSLHHEADNPAIRTAGSPFFVNTALRPWPAPVGADGRPLPRMAAVSSFGFSGTNAHVVLEEFRASRPAVASGLPRLVVLSAPSMDQLREVAARLSAHVEAHPDVALDDVAWTLLVGRKHLRCRFACVASSAAELRDKVARWLAGEDLGDEVHAGEPGDQRTDGDAALQAQGEALLRAGAACTSTGSAAELRPMLATLAGLYVKGYRLTYASLWRARRGRRVPLPVFPFARDRFWVDEGQDAAGSAPLPAARRAPASWTFAGDEPRLRDHQVRGVAMLAGAEALQLMGEALAVHGERSGGWTLHNVVWRQPIVAGERGVELSLRAGEPAADASIELAIVGGRGGQGAVHVSAIGRPGATPAEQPRIDLVALRARARDAAHDGAACYAAFERGGFRYGPTYRTIRSLHKGTDECGRPFVLARLALGTPAGGPAAAAALLDGAIQSAIGLAAGPDDDRGIPVALDELVSFGPVGGEAWAWVADLGTPAGESEPRGLQIHVMDGEGRLCMALRGLRSRRGGAAPTPPTSRPRAYAKIGEAPVGHFHAPAQPNAADRAPVQHAAFIGIAPPPGLARAEVLSLSTEDAPDRRYESLVTKLLALCRPLLAAASGPAATSMLLQLVLPRDPQHRLLAGVAGLLRSLALEAPGFRGQVVLVDRALAPAELASLLQRCAAEPARPVIDDDRSASPAEWRELTPAAAAGTVWREGGVYLVTGGAGALGRLWAAHILRQVPAATVVLVGRRALPPVVQASLERMAPGGRGIDYRVCDVADRAAAAALVADIEARHGRLDGVIHAAGVLKDGRAVEKTAADLAAVLAPKVSGTVNLDEATRHLRLDFFALFSSTASELGNIGQADYAAANGFLDRYAAYRRERVAQGLGHGRSVAINWPLWAEGGMQVAPHVQELLFASTGMRALATADGLRLFEAIIAGTADQVLVMAGDESRFGPLLRPPAAAVPAAVPVPRRATDAAVRAAFIAELTTMIAAVVGFAAQRIQPTMRFDVLGLDSLMVMSLTSRLEQRFGELPKTLFFEYQCVGDLADHLLRRFPEVVARGLNLPARDEPAAVPAPAEPVAPLPMPTGPAAAPATLDERIAIIGVAGRYPRANDLKAFWRNLADGVDCIEPLPADRWAGAPHDLADVRGGFLEGVDRFDPLFFHINPREAEFMEPQERLFLQCAHQVLEDAGYTRQTVCRRGGDHDDEYAGGVGVFVGVMYQEYQLYGAQAQMRERALAHPGVSASVANRVSFWGDFDGPSVAVDSMCSSSLTAIHLAVQAIQRKDCRVAIAGGVNVSIHPNKYVALGQGRFLASSGRCKSFGEGGDGYVPGEGVGAVLLKPLRDAIADRDAIHAVVLATSINHGGRANGFTVPNPRAQARVVAGAMRRAGVRPQDVGYIEAHGTGTWLGDPIEIAGLVQAFGESAPSGGRCAIGSVKSNIGHAESAAGIAGLTKVLLQLRHRELAPSIHCDPPNPNIRFDETPFRVVAQRRPWAAPAGEGGEPLPRIAGVSSFGAGGANAHVLVAEHLTGQDVAHRVPAAGSEVAIVLSAADREGLQHRVADLLEAIDAGEVSDSCLGSVAYTLQLGREELLHRLACVVRDVASLRTTLHAWRDGRSDQALATVFEGRTDGGQAIATLFDDAELERTAAGWLAARDHARALRRWVQGVRLDWRQAWPDPPPPRVHLPVYRFRQTRYWLPLAATPAAPVVDRRAALVTAWQAQPDAGIASSPVEGCTLLLATPGSRRVAAALKQALVARGSEALVLMPGGTTADIGLDLDDPASAERALAEVAARLPGRRIAALVDLASADDARNGAATIDAGTLRLLQRLVEQHGRAGLRLLQVAWGGEAGPDGAPRLRGARHAGLYRMLGAEQAAVRSSVLDLDDDDPQAVAAVVADELARLPAWTGSELRYRAGVRQVARLQDVAASAAAVDHRTVTYAADEVLLITGGTRGIGAALARHVVRQGARRLVLLGREPLPAYDAWPAILASQDASPVRERVALVTELRALGAEVRVETTPLSDRAALQALCADLRRHWGPVTGVFHCAGLVSANPAFHRKRLDDIAAVCQPKIAGLQNLHQVLRDPAPRFFVAFSSMTGCHPRLASGQGDYAMANGFMDAYIRAWHAAGHSYLKSIQWPVWSEAGMARGWTPSAVSAALGLVPLPTAEALDSLETWLRADLPVVAPCRLSDGGRALLDAAPAPLAVPAAPRAPASQPARPIAALPASAPRDAAIAWLTSIVGQELKIPLEDLSAARPFDEYGVDSISLAQMVQTIQAGLAEPIDPSALFEHPSIERLAAHLVAHHSDALRRLQAPAAEAPAAPLPATVPATVPQPEPMPVPTAAAPSAAPERGPAPAEGGTDLAIVGIGASLPGAPDHEAFWQLLADGRTAFSTGVDGVVPGPLAGRLRDLSLFDCAYFRIQPADARIMDPQARLILGQSLAALHDAGLAPAALSGRRVGVYVGGRGRIRDDQAGFEAAPNPILGVGQNYLATNVSRFFNLKGPSVVVDTACSSGLSALSFAEQALQLGRIDEAIVGAVSLLDGTGAHDLFAKRNLLNGGPEFHVFDERAGGEILGEGCVVLVVKRLQDAIRDGHRIYAVVKSIAINNDGRTIGPASPNAESQRSVMRDALERAGVRGHEVGYVEASAAGQPALDALELKHLTTLLDAAGAPPCHIGSVKPNVGHGLLSAGMAGLLRCVLSLHHRQRPPFLSGQQPLRHADLSASRLRFDRSFADWTAPATGRRIAVQNSFPDGGTNACVVLEEFVAAAGYRLRLPALPVPALRLIDVRGSGAGVKSAPPAAAVLLPAPVPAPTVASTPTPAATSGRLQSFLQDFARSCTVEQDR
jgi:acyl transferase domain-containing protein/NADPH:quinone reductase-like Zn-dependent oxidoreductase/SAM-dependent methyltransferase